MWGIFNCRFWGILNCHLQYCKIENMLRERSLLDKISPMDVLERFSTVYIIEDRKIITEVSKKVRELDKKLGTNIFPKNRS